jgi:glycerophosphoryl diester phosphodiesterase
VCAFTVDRVEDAVRLAALGVTGLFANDPGAVRRALAR